MFSLAEPVLTFRKILKTCQNILRYAGTFWHHFLRHSITCSYMLYHLLNIIYCVTIFYITSQLCYKILETFGNLAPSGIRPDHATPQSSSLCHDKYLPAHCAPPSHFPRTTHARYAGLHSYQTDRSSQKKYY